MEELITKENAIFEILQRFLNAKLEFIVVGGYAVSAYRHRFSVDADIVIQSRDLEKFEEILKKEHFKKTREKELENIYASKFMRYEKESASIDMLIDAIAAKATNGAFSYSILHENSLQKRIIGIEKEVEVRIPIREMIIAMKIHSGRLTDFRDITALAKGTNLKTIKKFLFIGERKTLRQHLINLREVLNKKGFADSFNGVFMEKKFDVDLEQVEKISNLREESELEK